MSFNLPDSILQGLIFCYYTFQIIFRCCFECHHCLFWNY